MGFLLYFTMRLLVSSRVAPPPSANEAAGSLPEHRASQPAPNTNFIIFI